MKEKLNATKKITSILWQLLRGVLENVGYLTELESMRQVAGNSAR